LRTCRARFARGTLRARWPVLAKRHDERAHLPLPVTARHSQQIRSRRERARQRDVDLARRRAEHRHRQLIDRHIRCGDCTVLSRSPEVLASDAQAIVIDVVHRTGNHERRILCGNSRCRRGEQRRHTRHHRAIQQLHR